LERRLQPAQRAPGGRRDGPHPPGWRNGLERRSPDRHARCSAPRTSWRCLASQHVRLATPAGSRSSGRRPAHRRV